MAESLTDFLGFFAHWGSVFWATLRDTGPFLVFGLLAAGALHVLIPSRFVLWALGQGGWRGAVRGAAAGIPLPLCSCGVVPTALALRRQGASLSATTAFTVSTPETSLDALAITAALLPVAFLGIRPLAALFLATIVGWSVELFSSTPRDELRQNLLKFSQAVTSPDSRKASEICRICGLMTEEQHQHGFFSKLAGVARYAFGTFFHDIATWLILGLLVAALIQIAVPASFFQAPFFRQNPSLQILVAILAGVPLYSCATATTPLVAVLIAKGLSPGAGLALLLAGPATNIGSVFALKRELGAHPTAVYYASLLIACWALGMAMNALWPLLSAHPGWTQVASIGHLSVLSQGMPGWIEVWSAWILVVLSMRSWAVSAIALFTGKDPHAGHGHDGGHGHEHGVGQDHGPSHQA